MKERFQWEIPLAIAMMGKVEGDEVEVEAQKKFMIKILKVEHL
ncbi:GreA/GreB family elongation factor [Mycoplasmopsis cynos]|nr:GreA/GreB family elongation factor [Mycoplasmopsis cynos]UWV77128.1 GreA/GreB family elongation factor [Mycoplasmopsis cynos]